MVGIKPIKSLNLFVFKNSIIGVLSLVYVEYPTQFAGCVHPVGRLRGTVYNNI